MMPAPVYCDVCGKFLRSEMADTAEPKYDTHVHLEDCIRTLTENLEELRREVRAK